MSLPRFIDTWHLRVALMTVAAVMIVGCASGPGGNTRDGDGAIPPKALTLYEQAVASMAAGDTTDAELRFKEFLLSYPDFPGAHINLAIIYSNRGDDAQAEASLSAALTIDPQHAVALNQLGMLRRRQGRFLEAESAYLKAVTATPDYALAHYNLGVLNDLYFQRLETALEHYERYQKLAGEDDQVGKWIVDLKRRIDAAQRTANVTE